MWYFNPHQGGHWCFRKRMVNKQQYIKVMINTKEWSANTKHPSNPCLAPPLTN